ncbi:unnamed protein product [Absidia cylindrospora]
MATASTVPELQGIVIVLLKQLLTTAAAKTRPTTKNGTNTDGQRKQQQEQQQQQQLQTMEAANVDRNREVLCKSISAILLLMLKWLKISRKSIEIWGKKFTNLTHTIFFL